MTDVTNDTQQTQTNTDSVLANWQAQAAPLANYAAESQVLLEETQRALGALWEKAELENDDQAKQMISDSWQRAQALHNQVTHMDAGLAGAGATIQTLDDQRKAALDELKSLIDAIEDGDESHPQLSEFAEEIREDAYEIASDEDGLYADDYAHENLYDEIDQRVREIFVEVEDQTSLLVDFLYGNITLTPEQQGLFTQFIESLRDHEEVES